ncbi:MAG: sulfatase [Candidatus Latescibacterota bacterium]|nr:MAG: sulfatase [Candidatus Latescibacterota bacterium]
MNHPDHAKNTTLTPRDGWAVVASILAIFAAGIAFNAARTEIDANHYLDGGMNGLAALEIGQGIYAGVARALLVGAGGFLFWAGYRVLLLFVSASEHRRALISLAALGFWLIGFIAYNRYVSPRLPYPFPTTDIPVVAWGGLLMGAVVLLERIRAAVIPGMRLRFSLLRKAVVTLGCIAAAFLIVGFGYAKLSRPPAPLDRPNVLLIVLDTVRQQNLSLYGYARKTTPHLDRFAKECAVYDNAYAVAPWTIPNHAAMFTGMYTCQHGARLGAPELRGVVTTLAELLYEDGYETIAYSNNPVIAGTRGYAQGFEAYNQPWERTFGRLFRALPHLSGRPEDAGAHVTGKLTEKWVKHRDTSRPFFLFINYLEAHSRYWPPQEYRFAFVPDDTPLTDANTQYDFVGLACGTVKKTDGEQQNAMGFYDGEILYLDHCVNELMGCLRETGALDNTVVIITSDHGEEFGEHDLVGHEFGLYNTLLKVPLIIRYPKLLSPGRYGDHTQLIDLFTTILAGTRSPYDTSGDVLAYNLFERPQRREVIAENYHEYQKFQNKVAERCPDTDVTSFVSTLRSIRIGDFKLIASSSGDLELYNKATDPGETTNLADENPELAAELDVLIASWFERTKTPLVEMQRDASEDSEELRKKLRALGYIQ